MRTEAAAYYTRFKYCPACGAAYDPAFRCAEDVMLLCGACKFEFYQNSIPSVSVVIPNSLARSEVLLIKRANEPAIGKLALPGGITQYGERAQDAIARETKEETCLDIQVTGILSSQVVDYRYQGSAYKMLEIAFQAAPVADQVAHIKTPEASELQFVDVRKYDRDELAFPEQSNAIEKYRESLTY